LGCLGLALSVQAAATSQPATQPTSKPATDPKVEAILDRLEKAGDNIKDLKAKVQHELYQIIPDDRQIKLGMLAYRAAVGDQDAKFMIHFDTMIHDELKLLKKEWFCFDGKWFREIREQTRGVIDREVVAPGEKFDPFKLGEGPFPLPFGQKKAEILKEFKVTLIPPTKDDPAKTDHLLMIPLETGKFHKKYKQVEFWVDQKGALPVKMVSEDRHSNIITATFKDIELNTNIPDEVLWVPAPPDYSYTREPLN
jgi:hypothetical protein